MELLKEKGKGGNMPDFADMGAKPLNHFYEKGQFNIKGFEDMSSAQKREALTFEVGKIKESSTGASKKEVEEKELKIGIGSDNTEEDKEAGTVVETPDAEVIPVDPISKTAAEISVLSTAEKATSLLNALVDEREFNFFKLGGVLHVIHEHGWIGDYKSFKGWCDDGHAAGVAYRRCMIFIKLYSELVASGIPWGKVKKVGWSKLAVLAPVMTPENAGDLVAKANGMTTLQLKEEFGLLSKANKVTTRTFKLHEDQRKTVDAALEKFMDTEGDSGKQVADKETG